MSLVLLLMCSCLVTIVSIATEHINFSFKSKLCILSLPYHSSPRVLPLPPFFLLLHAKNIGHSFGTIAALNRLSAVLDACLVKQAVNAYGDAEFRQNIKTIVLNLWMCCFLKLYPSINFIRRLGMVTSFERALSLHS